MLKSILSQNSHPFHKILNQGWDLPRILVTTKLLNSNKPQTNTPKLWTTLPLKKAEKENIHAHHCLIVFPSFCLFGMFGQVWYVLCHAITVIFVLTCSSLFSNTQT